MITSVNVFRLACKPTFTTSKGLTTMASVSPDPNPAMAKVYKKSNQCFKTSYHVYRVKHPTHSTMKMNVMMRMEKLI